MADEAKKVGQAVGYVDAVSDLLEQFRGTDDATIALREVQGQAQRFKTMFNETIYVGREYEALTKGPKWHKKNLEQDIRSTTQYVKRLNRFVAKAALLGSEWSAVLGIHEVNNGVQKLTSLQRQIFAQQTMRHLDEKAIELKEKKQWEALIERERIRRQEFKENVFKIKSR